MPISPQMRAYLLGEHVQADAASGEVLGGKPMGRPMAGFTDEQLVREATEGQSFGQSALLGIRESIPAKGLNLLGGGMADELIESISGYNPDQLETQRFRMEAARQRFGIERDTGTILREGVGGLAGMLALDIPGFFTPGGLFLKAPMIAQRVGRLVGGATAGTKAFRATLFNSGVLFGSAGSTREILDQIETGEIDPVRVATAFAKEAAVGVAMGGSRFLGPKVQEGVAETVGRKAARFGAQSAGELGAFGVVAPAAHGDFASILTYENLIMATATVAGFKALEVLRYPNRRRKDYLDSVRGHRDRLSKENRVVLDEVERLLGDPKMGFFPEGFETKDSQGLPIHRKELIDLSVAHLVRQMEVGRFDAAEKVLRPAGVVDAFRERLEGRAIVERAAEIGGPQGLGPIERARELATPVRRAGRIERAEKGPKPPPPEGREDVLHATPEELAVFRRGESGISATGKERVRAANRRVVEARKAYEDMRRGKKPLPPEVEAEAPKRPRGRPKATQVGDVIEVEIVKGHRSRGRVLGYGPNRRRTLIKLDNESEVAVETGKVVFVERPPPPPPKEEPQLRQGSIVEYRLAPEVEARPGEFIGFNEDGTVRVKDHGTGEIVFVPTELTKLRPRDEQPPETPDPRPPEEKPPPETPPATRDGPVEPNAMGEVATLENYRRTVLEAQRVNFLEGRDATIPLSEARPGEPTQVEAIYGIMEAADAQPSHLTNFQPRPTYPEGINNRNYHMDAQGRPTAERAKVLTYQSKIATNERVRDGLVSDVPYINDGPPAVLRTGQSVGGSGRLLAVLRTYEQRGPAAEAYRSSVIGRATHFGMSVEHAGRFREPVLVRIIRETPKDHIAAKVLSDTLNRGLTQEVDPAAQGVVNAARFTPETLRVIEDEVGRRLKKSEAGDIESAPTTRQLISGSKIIERLWKDGIITKVNQPRLLAKDGKALSPEGVLTVERALLGRMIESESIVSALAGTQLESKLLAVSPFTVRISRENPEFAVEKLMRDVAESMADYQNNHPHLLPRDYVHLDSSSPTPAQKDSRAASMFTFMVNEKTPEIRRRFAEFAEKTRPVTEEERGLGILDERTPESIESEFHRLFGKQEAPEDTGTYSLFMGREEARPAREVGEPHHDVQPAFTKLGIQGVDEAAQMVFEFESSRGSRSEAISGKGVVTFMKAISRVIFRRGDWLPEGKIIRTPEQAAAIFQFARDPRMEHTVFAVVGRDGRVKGYRHFSIGSPIGTELIAMPREVSERILGLLREGRSSEAQELYVRNGTQYIEGLRRWVRSEEGGYLVAIHNHPNGNPRPSGPDFTAYTWLRQQIPELKYGLILDKRSASIIEFNQGGELPVLNVPERVAAVESARQGGIEATSMTYRLSPELTSHGDAGYIPEVPHPLLNTSAKSSVDLLAAARSVLDPASVVGVVFRGVKYSNGRPLIFGLQSYPKAMFEEARLRETKRTIQGQAREFGAMDAVAVYAGANDSVMSGLRLLMQGKILRDIVAPRGPRGEGVAASSPRDPATAAGVDYSSVAGRSIGIGAASENVSLSLPRRERTGEKQIRAGEKRVVELLEGAGLPAYTAEPVPREARGRTAPVSRADRPTKTKRKRTPGIVPGVEVNVTDLDPKFTHNPDRAFAPEVAKWVHRVAEHFPSAIEVSRRGAMSNEMIKRAARAWGMDPRSYLSLRQGMILPVEGEVHLASLIDGVGTTLNKVTAELAKINAQPRTPETVAKKIELEGQLEGLSQSMAQLVIPWYKVGSELGRALGARSRRTPTIDKITHRAMRVIMEERQLSKGMQEALLKRLVEAQGDRGEIIQVIQEAYMPTWWDAFVEFRVMMLLSSPVTQARNIVGNTAALATRLMEDAAGIPIDAFYGMTAKALGRETRPGQARHALELWADLTGTMQGIIEGSNLAMRAFREPFDPANPKSFRERFTEAEPFAIARGRIGAEVGTPKAAISSRLSAGKAPQILDPIGTLIRMPGRALSAADMFFTTINRSGEAYRLAAREILNRENVPVGSRRMAEIEKLGKEAMSIDHARLNELVREIEIADERRLRGVSSKELNLEPVEIISARSELAGKEFTFRKKLGALAKVADQARFAHNLPGRLGRILVPFFPTPVNIMKFGLERSPFTGYITEHNRRAWMRGNREEMVDAYARYLVGSAIVAPIFLMAMNGYITGDPPKSRAAKVQAHNSGWQEYSVRLSPELPWFSYRGFSPLTEIMASVSEMAHLWNTRDVAPKPWDQWVTKAVLASLGTSLDQPFLTGVTDLVEALRDERGGEWRIDTIIQNLVAGTTVPRGMAFLARAMDPTLRAFPEKTSQRLMLEWPGTRGDTIPFRDPLGRTHESGNSWLNAVVRNRESIAKSPVDAMLFEAEGGAIGLIPEKALVGFPRRTFLGRHVTPKPYNELLQVRGEMLRPVLERIARGNWRRIPIDELRSTINEVERKTSDIAKAKVLVGYEIQELGIPDSSETRSRLMAIWKSGPLRNAYSDPTADRSAKLRILNTMRP